MLPDLATACFRLVSSMSEVKLIPAINVMAAFVHNEPTSLSVLQELGLPQALYDELERDFPTNNDVRHRSRCVAY
jgi:E3 ubiquitin-protein ligase HUWE1